jgi:hypothetical protein
MSGNLGMEFNAGDVAPSSGSGAIPKGDYTVVVEQSEVKENSKGTGYYLALTYQVVDGEHKGWKLWQYINHINASEKAQQIGRAELSALCRACGVMNLQDSSQLHDIPIRVRVGHEKGQDDEPRAVVKAILWKETTKPDVGKFSGGGGEGGGSPAPASLAVAGSFDDDEIPF